MDIKLAFYSCYFGGDSNHSKMTPPLPSKKYPCYFYTNNKDTLDNSLRLGWISIFREDIPIYNDSILDTMSSKSFRAFPHNLDELKDNFEYTCWLDSKLAVDENKVEEIIYQLDNSQKVMALTSHPNNHKSVWDEYHLSIQFQKYGSQKDQYFKYINDKLNNGYSESIKNHYCMGFNLRKKSEISDKINLDWYNNILECGIEDQISFQFVQQDYSNYILTLPYQHGWKYSFESL